MSTSEILLSSFRYRFRSIKDQGDKTLKQLSSEQIFWRPTPHENSIEIIMQHLHGNMLSRWTDFLTTDGEKTSRKRDEEFVAHEYSKEALLNRWEEGWTVLLNAIDSLTAEDLTKTITIRGQHLDVVDACVRQVAHYSYHIGQMILLAKIQLGEDWQTLSIAIGKSEAYRPTKRD